MAEITVVTPYPLSPGDARIVFDLAGEGILSRKDCELLSLIDEAPEGKNGTPTDEQLARYAADFRASIEASQSSVLVLLDCGGSPLLRTFGLVPVSIERLRGYCLEPKDCREVTVRERAIVGEYKSNCKGGRKGDPKWGFVATTRTPTLPRGLAYIVPSLHPKHVRQDGLKSIPCLRADLGRAARLAQGVVPVEFSFGSDLVPSGRMIALDLETPRGYIELVGMSDGQTTWASAWNACSADVVNRRMRDACTWKVFHNASFDIPWLEREGIMVSGRVFDTMLAAHLIQPDLYKSLEKASTLYLDLRPFKYISTSDLARPAADSQVTALLFHEQWRILEQTGQLKLFLDTIMPATRVLMSMTKRGIRVDRDRLALWQSELSGKLSGLLAQWYATQPTVNPFSPPQLKKYLYGELGLPVQSTKYAAVTTDEGALKALIASHPDHAEGLGLLLRIREIAKLKGTYSEVEIGPDGCVHPQYLPESKDTDAAGAATGRLASRNPNIQQQPQEARNLFITHDPDMVLVEADFSQIEPRICQALSGDMVLAKAIERGLYDELAKVLEAERQAGKQFFLMTCYGSGPRHAAQVLRTKYGFTYVTESMTKAWQNRIAQEMPVFWGWRQTVAQEAKTNRVLVNPFGRRRYFYGDNTPAAIDYLPQSCAADILWASLKESEGVAVAHEGNVLTTVHDSLLFEVPGRTLAGFVSSIREVLEREWPQIAPGFRVPVKVKVGKSWGEMEEYDARRLVEN